MTSLKRKSKYDLHGNVYGKLKVTSFHGRDKRGELLWSCICECGNIHITYSSSLRSGKVDNCGCYSTYKRLNTFIKNHGEGHGMKHTRIYSMWSNMKTRCYNPKYNQYEHYGGKGITVCDDWIDFNKFMNWAFKNGYSDSLTIDRIDNSLGYNQENCKFSTMKEQQNNRTNNRLLLYKDVIYTLSELSELLEIKYYLLQKYITKGTYPVGVSEVEYD